MPEHSLSPLSPLGDEAPRSTQIGGFRLIERADFALASVAARDGRVEIVRESLASLLGKAPDAGRLEHGKEHMGFWIGPDQWMIEADHDPYEDLAAQLKTTLGDAVSITEQNDGWVVVDLEGSALRAVLERLANIDVSRFDAGCATRCSIEHMGCFLLCLDHGEHYRILAGRSFAGSLWHALTTTCASVAAINQAANEHNRSNWMRP